MPCTCLITGGFARAKAFFWGCFVAGRTGVVGLLLLIHWNSIKSSLQSVRAHVFGIARGLLLGRYVPMKRANSWLYGWTSF
jgi:hypothetical protein